MGADERSANLYSPRPFSGPYELQTRLLAQRPAPEGGYYALMNSNKSALITSACVVAMPCGKPG